MNTNLPNILKLTAACAVSAFGVSCTTLEDDYGYDEFGNDTNGYGAPAGGQYGYGQGGYQQQPYAQPGYPQQAPAPYYQGQQPFGQPQQQAPGYYGGYPQQQPQQPYQQQGGYQGYPAQQPAPAPAPTPSYSSGGGGSHTVQHGETLWGISQRHNTSVGAIQSANNLSGDQIFPGDVLILP